MQGGPRIKQLDDVPWIEVSKFRLADGTIARIQEKWIEMTPRYVCFYNKWDSGALSPPHGHTGDHSVFILEGEVSCGDVTCGPGSHLMLEWGDIFGPWVAGPDGCVMYGFIAGNGKPFVDKDRWQKYLAEHGVEELPVPPPPLPVWSDADVLPSPLSDAG